MSRWVVGLFAVTAAVLVGAVIWAFVVVIGLMQSRLGLSMWEAVAVLVLASFIFGSSGVSGRSKS